MDKPLIIANEAELAAILKEHAPHEGEECITCGRLAPKKKSDDRPGPTRSVISLHEPRELAGTLDPMLIALVDKYHEQWPRDNAAMRHDVGLEVVGGRCWRYHAVHFATYACLMVPGLEPTEVG